MVRNLHEHTPETDRIMAEHWAKGLSALQIGKLMGGRTKNVIIGRAHRIGLPGRASPIKGSAAEAKHLRSQQKTAALTAANAPIPSHPEPANDERPVEYPLVVHAPKVPLVATVVSFVQRPPAMGDLATHDGHRCRYPMWGNQRPGRDPEFCKARSQNGKPYCVEHAQRAYIRRCDGNAA